MKKILVFVIAIAMSVAHAGAAVRDGNTTQRTANQKRIATTATTTKRTTNARTTVLAPVRGTTSRQQTTDSTNTRQQSSVVNRTATNNSSRQQNAGVSARAATTPAPQMTIYETRTGAAYDKCKSAFFTCMDQFCALKNDDYRRCSCSNRITAMEKQRATLNDVGEQLTIFTENLDVVGLTAAQATAMRTASEGENALATDTSASKALLQAIMNSISGGDTTVSGKYSDLNTINISYDLSTSFGLSSNQLISSYNGQELYSAVYPQCRKVVADDCNSASLQRAVNAYLMAIEQDCNTVQTAIEERQSQMKSAIREGSAMLDLARVENRRKHNSDNLTECINNIETAILSEEVCGANYHKCLDNGEFIDVSTGAPIAGVVKFNELGKLLTFDPKVDAANQQLSKRANNRVFVSNFEKRTKNFAEPALDKCREIADEAWSEYLDKAMLAIYYAQQSKVDEIKQGCFDFVSNCYMDSDASITAAMAGLIGSGVTILQPDKIALTTKMCADYVDSCNNMFEDEGNIIENYVNNRQDTDTLTACRAIVKQCFDKYGGTGYENFYYPYGGLFQANTTAGPDVTTPGDWFTLYDRTGTSTETTYKSPCANQLTTIPACDNEDIIREAFGGFDRMYTTKDQNEQDQLSFNVFNTGDIRYGIQTETFTEDATDPNAALGVMRNRVLRPVGVATEVYNQIVDALTIQCSNINGRFVERQFIKENLYGGRTNNNTKPNICLWYPQAPSNAQQNSNNDNTMDYYRNQLRLGQVFGIVPSTIDDSFIGENMCPRDYNLNVDSSFWGACLCWENGGRRSKNGKSAICVTELPTTTEVKDARCKNNDDWTALGTGADDNTKFYFWCTQFTDSTGKVCPYQYIFSIENDNKCIPDTGVTEISEDILKLIPDAKN